MRAKHSSKYGIKTKKCKKVATFFCVLHCACESDCKTSIEQRNTAKKSRYGVQNIHPTQKYNKNK